MQNTFSNITSGLVGGLVLSYVLFMGYALTVAHQSNEVSRSRSSVTWLYR
jgi:CHASE3 domain sensor protein